MFCHGLGLGMKEDEGVCGERDGSSQLLFYSFTQGDTTRRLERKCVRACKTNGKQQNITYIHPSDQTCCSAQERRALLRNEKKQVAAWRFLIKKSHLYSFLHA